MITAIASSTSPERTMAATAPPLTADEEELPGDGSVPLVADGTELSDGSSSSMKVSQN